MNSDTQAPTSSETASRAVGEEGSGGKLGQVAGRADQGKRIVHTIHPDFITGIGRVSAFGAKKYHMRNFLKAPGMAWGRVYDSAVGHLQSFWGGEKLDEESGQPHILMAAWNIMVLHLYSTESAYAAGDDRPATVEYAGKTWEEWEANFKALALGEPATPKSEGMTNFFDAFAKSSGNTRGPRPGKEVEGMREESSLARTDELLRWCKAQNKKSCSLDLRDLENLINMAKGT